MNSQLSHQLIEQATKQNASIIHGNSKTLENEIMHPLLLRAQLEPASEQTFIFKKWNVEFSPERKSNALSGFPYRIYHLLQSSEEMSLFFPKLGSFSFKSLKTDCVSQETVSLPQKWLDYCFSDDQWAVHGRWERFKNEIIDQEPNAFVKKIAGPYYILHHHYQNKLTSNMINFETTEEGLIVTPGWSWGLSCHHKFLKTLKG